ncbi:MAG: RDD family protein [Gammaproteobacteria bacterium]|nr:RDD family protein [Gammaproteobacteria bacterium]
MSDTELLKENTEATEEIEIKDEKKDETYDREVSFNRAGLGKRLFSALTDLFLVIATCFLLYLFPFNMIISKSIDSDYKNSIQKPYDQLTEKYSGSSTMFGTASEGIYSIYTSNYDAGTTTLKLTKEEYDLYLNYFNDAYSGVNNRIDGLLEGLNEYDASKAEALKYHAQLYMVYTYADFAYQTLFNYPHNEQYVNYVSLLNSGALTKAEYNTLVETYKTELNNEFLDVIEVLLEAFNKYNELYPEANILKTNAYDGVKSKYSRGVKTLESKLDAEGISKLKAFVERYEDYSMMQIDKTYSSDEEELTFNDSAYYIFYYSIYLTETAERMPYFEKYSTHTTWVIIYSLVMFTVVLSLYTSIMRGYTLGRRWMKCMVINKKDSKKASPLLALLHDVPFKYLYVLVIGFFSLRLALIVFAVMSIVDVIMIAIRPHKAIRDYISFTEVVES